MPTQHNYTCDLFDTDDADELLVALSLSSLTPLLVHVRHLGDLEECTAEIMVAEENVSADDVAGSITANLPAPRLSVSSSHLQVPGDGETTAKITVADSRGAAAIGERCKFRVQPGVATSASFSPSSCNLDASGQAEFTIGPSNHAGMLSVPFVIEFYLESGSAVKARTVVEFTG